MGLVRLYYALPSECEILLQIHDAVVIQVLNELTVTTYTGIIRKCMEFPIWINGHKIVIPVDIKEGRNWKDVS